MSVEMSRVVDTVVSRKFGIAGTAIIMLGFAERWGEVASVAKLLIVSEAAVNCVRAAVQAFLRRAS